jgi:NAD+ synthase (glutamine-hydrolysing)
VVVGDDLSHLQELDSDIDLVVSINSRRYGKGLLTYRLETLRNLTYTEARNVVIINQVGGAGDLVYDGTSGVMNKSGELELMLKSFEEDFQIYDTEAENEPIEVPFTSYNDRTRIVYKAACLGLRDYFHKNGYKKACVGLSGGIDSSVVACLAVGALGAENVKGLMLPSQFSSESSVEDAKKLAENLGIDFSVLPISEAYTAIMNTLKPITGGTEFDATEENIQSRIRTVLLMALQNKDGYVLLNSSNKSENAIGWCTLYGDTAGAFSVTGDLYKSEIYDLARYINTKFGDIIPEEILKKEPTSELRPGQKDSDILPPYEVVDAILYRMIEQGQHREEIINAGFDSEVVEKIHTMIMRNVKKRYQYPPVLRLSTSSFRHECLFPLVNKYGY